MQEFANNMPVHVSQTKITTGHAIGQSLVIEAQQVQHRGVQVMHRNRLLDRSISEVVGRSVGVSAANPGTGQPAREAIVVVIATAESR